jgi:oxygen-independent coproporphyrinogen-3 oxidase
MDTTALCIPARIPPISPGLIRKYNVPGPRYTSYPTAPRFTSDVCMDALLADADADLGQPRDISIYVHIPFCKTLCWYCACNTHPATRPAIVSGYLDALARELQLWQRRHSGSLPRYAQLHFGGGTPTHLTPGEITRLGDLIHAACSPAPGAEISVEIDPRNLTPEHLAAYHRLGATRASFGVQDFSPATQRAINRIQSIEVTADAIRWARAAGYTTINLDLIYGLPHQTPESIQRTLDHVLAFAPDRLAVFSYAHVPWLRPAQKRLERTGALPDAERKLELLQTIITRLADAGYAYIGMDHFALPGDELAIAQREKRLQRNFQGYSTRAGHSILGLGSTAISQTPNAFRQNEKELSLYHARLASDTLPIAKGVLLSEEDKRRRTIIAHIMCDREIDFGSLGEKLRVDIPRHYASELSRLVPLADDGLVRIGTDRITVLPAGWLFLRNIAMCFDAYLDPASPLTRHSRTI